MDREEHLDMTRLDLLNKHKIQIDQNIKNFISLVLENSFLYRVIDF